MPPNGLLSMGPTFESALRPSRVDTNPKTPPLFDSPEGSPKSSLSPCSSLELSDDSVVPDISPTPASPLYLNASDLEACEVPVMRFDPRSNESPKSVLESRKAKRKFASSGDLVGLRRRHKDTPGDIVGAARAPTNTLFDATLLERWEDALAEGRFRYDVTTCPNKTLEGQHAFIMQLNVGRATSKRPTEFSADRVVQPFDSQRFNFTKARQDELVFTLEKTKTMRKSRSMSSFAPAAAPAPSKGASPDCVLINVSPIEYGHVLLVPRILDSLPQQLGLDTLHLALHMAAESANEHFRIGFNSLGAYATINHLHFQGYYLFQSLPLELAATSSCFSTRGVDVRRTVDYPVRVLVCSASAGSTQGGSLKQLASVVSEMCVHFQQRNMPYNLLICDGGRKVYVIPQRFSRALAAGEVSERVIATGVNPAVFEIAGHLVLKRDEDYDSMRETDAVELLEAASLSERDFAETVDEFSGDNRLVPCM